MDKNVNEILDEADEKGLLEKNLNDIYSPVNQCGPSKAAERAPLMGGSRNRLKRASVKVGFLHDPQKLLLVHLAVSVSVGLVDHFLEGGENQVRGTENTPGCSWRGKSNS